METEDNCASLNLKKTGGKYFSSGHPLVPCVLSIIIEVTLYLLTFYVDTYIYIKHDSRYSDFKNDKNMI